MFLVTNFYFRHYEFIAVYQCVADVTLMPRPDPVYTRSVNWVQKMCFVGLYLLGSDKKVSECRRMFTSQNVLKNGLHATCYITARFDVNGVCQSKIRVCLYCLLDSYLQVFHLAVYCLLRCIYSLLFSNLLVLKQILIFL